MTERDFTLKKYTQLCEAIISRYHYEALDIAKGDVKKAIEIFGQELKELREIAPIKTICMHGNLLTSRVR